MDADVKDALAVGTVAVMFRLADEESSAFMKGRSPSVPYVTSLPRMSPLPLVWGTALKHFALEAPSRVRNDLSEESCLFHYGGRGRDGVVASPWVTCCSADHISGDTRRPKQSHRVVLVPLHLPVGVWFDALVAWLGREGVDTSGAPYVQLRLRFGHFPTSHQLNCVSPATMQQFWWHSMKESIWMRFHSTRAYQKLNARRIANLWRAVVTISQYWTQQSDSVLRFHPDSKALCALQNNHTAPGTQADAPVTSGGDDGVREQVDLQFLLEDSEGEGEADSTGEGEGEGDHLSNSGVHSPRSERKVADSKPVNATGDPSSDGKMDAQSPKDAAGIHEPSDTLISGGGAGGLCLQVYRAYPQLYACDNAMYRYMQELESWSFASVSWLYKLSQRPAHTDTQLPAKIRADTKPEGKADHTATTGSDAHPLHSLPECPYHDIPVRLHCLGFGTHRISVKSSGKDAAALRFQTVQGATADADRQVVRYAPVFASRQPTGQTLRLSASAGVKNDGGSGDSGGKSGGGASGGSDGAAGDSESQQRLPATSPSEHTTCPPLADSGNEASSVRSPSAGVTGNEDQGAVSKKLRELTSTPLSPVWLPAPEVVSGSETDAKDSKTLLDATPDKDSKTLLDATPDKDSKTLLDATPDSHTHPQPTPTLQTGMNDEEAPSVCLETQSQWVERVGGSVLPGGPACAFCAENQSNLWRVHHWFLGNYVTSWGDLLFQLIPSCFVEVRAMDDTSTTTTTTTTAQGHVAAIGCQCARRYFVSHGCVRQLDPRVIVLVQGMAVPLWWPAVQVYTLLAHLDGFLHVAVVKQEK